MDDWLAPLNLIESVEKYIELFRVNGLVSPEDLYMSDYKIDDFLKMGITNENDRTAIYYAINPEELASLADSIAIASVDEDDIDRQIREAEAQLQGTLIDLGKEPQVSNTLETEIDPADLEAQIAEAEMMMKALESEISDQSQLTPEQLKELEEQEEKALDEKIRKEEEALKKLENDLKIKEENERIQKERLIQEEYERINNEKILKERELLVMREREKLNQMNQQQQSPYDGASLTLDNSNFLNSVAVKDGRMQSDYTYKIIIIGDSGVGKSNIINRWMGGIFSHDLPPTIQCAYSSKTFHVGDAFVDVQLWDTAGQERYVSLTRSFYRGAHGVVLVYDLCNRTSFTALTKWIDTVSIEIEVLDTHFIVIGNKSDYADQHREVSVEEGLNFAKSQRMFFLETSALDGSNCNKALQILLQEIHNKYAIKLDTNPLTPEENSKSQIKSGVVLNQQKKEDTCGC